jgi:hypothetical protein
MKKTGISLICIALLVVFIGSADRVEGIWHEKDKSILEKGKEFLKEKAAVITGGYRMNRPEGYREWIFVGAPVTPNDLNDGKAAFPEFHNVYIDPDSYAEYKKTGAFRNGTTLVKELVSVGTKKAVSGNGYFQGEYIGLEVAVKDSEKFPEEPGNWAYFSFTDPGKPIMDTATISPESACNACHKANAAEDRVFTQYYPVLKAAKPMK